MRVLRGIGLATLLACPLAACTAPAGDALTKELLRLGGADSRDCGVASRPEERGAVLECARTALAQRQAFRVAVMLQGVDSVVMRGAVRAANGDSWVLAYDSDVYGHSGGSEGHFEVRPFSCRELRFDAAQPEVIWCGSPASAPK